MKAGVARNFVYNVIGPSIPIATSLATVPLYLDRIGTDRYGVVAITWLLLGYFNFLDFGLSRASANALGRLGDAPAAERSPVLMTAFYTNAMLGVIGGVIMYGGAQLLLLHAFRIPAHLMPELRPAIPWMAAMLPLGLLGGIATGAMESRERFLVSNVLSTVGVVVGQVAPLIAAYVIGPQLYVVVPASFATRLVMISIMYVVVARLEWPVRPFTFDRTIARSLFGYGLWVSVSSVLGPILQSFDQILIGTVLGSASVARYAVPMNLTMRSQVVATALSRTLFPRLSRLPRAEAANVTRDAIVTLGYGFGAIIAPAILGSDLFLRLWVGPHFAAISAPVAALLLLGAWTNGMAFLPYTLLQGQGRPDITAKVHAVEVVPFVAILWLLLHALGLPGAALAWTLRVTIDCAVLLVLSGQWRDSVGRLAPLATALAVCTGVSLLLDARVAAALAPLASLAVIGLGVGREPIVRARARAVQVRIARSFAGPTGHRAVNSP